MLSQKAASEYGQWDTERTPYLREVMDALSVTSRSRRHVFMKGAQLGGTEAGNNWLGYVIGHAPAPMLLVYPTVDVSRRVSKQRIAPMIEATPELRGRVRDPRSRDSSNTTFEKEFDGGLMIITGANSGAGLRQMPMRYIFLDEVDEFPGDVEGQGDPIVLAEKRTLSFGKRAKILMVSTPTRAGFSRIDREYERSDRRKFHVPCPSCGKFDWIQWSKGGYRGRAGHHHHIVWKDSDPFETIGLCCSECGVIHNEGAKGFMLPRGKWEPTWEDAEKYDGETVGFHISSLYSPIGWLSWRDALAEFLRAKGNQLEIKAWVNTVLGEVYEDHGSQGAEPAILLSRAKAEALTVDPRGDLVIPAGAGALVAAVDVQGSYLEAQVKAYGAGEESWLVAWEQMLGDPGEDEVWFALDKFLARTFQHENGRTLRIDLVAVDTGGPHPERVYRYCAARLNGRPFQGEDETPSRIPRTVAIKGGNIPGLPLVPRRPSRPSSYRTPLFVLCVDTGKDIVSSRLRISDRDQPGYMHLPPWVDSEYVAQLTAERAVPKYDKRLGMVRRWQKIRERNEAFDLEVYSLAALYILGPAFVRDLGKRAKLWARPPVVKAETAGDEAPPARRARRPRWRDWRRR